MHKKLPNGSKLSPQRITLIKGYKLDKKIIRVCNLIFFNKGLWGEVVIKNSNFYSTVNQSFKFVR